jgi:UDP-glucose 4-epimerase
MTSTRGVAPVNNILITGGAGFIGMHLVKRLLAISDDIGLESLTIIDNLLSQQRGISRKSVTTTFPSHRALHFYKEDIRNMNAVSNIIKYRGIDTCIHLAAVTDVGASIGNPIETIDINVMGTLNLLESCSSNGVRNFIFASSAAAYGKNVRLPIKENLPLQPMSPYGASKVAGEALVMAFKNMDRIQNAISLRFFNVYGHNQNPNYAGVITLFASRLYRGLPPIINGDGNQTRDFISVNDVASCIIMSVQALGHRKRQAIYTSCHPPHHVFNVGTGIPTSINELARKMIKISGFDLKPIHRNRANKGDIRNSYADTKLAESYLHFRANQKLESGLKEIINNPIRRDQKSFFK